MRFREESKVPLGGFRGDSLAELKGGSQESCRSFEIWVDLPPNPPRGAMNTRMDVLLRWKNTA
jgi:hypothetical protein